MTLIEPWLLEIMQCPRCQGELSENTETSHLVCGGCATAYPVVDGIPDMVPAD